MSVWGGADAGCGPGARDGVCGRTCHLAARDRIVYDLRPACGVTDHRHRVCGDCDAGGCKAVWQGDPLEWCQAIAGGCVGVHGCGRQGVEVARSVRACADYCVAHSRCGPLGERAVSARGVWNDTVRCKSVKCTVSTAQRACEAWRALGAACGKLAIGPERENGNGAVAGVDGVQKVAYDRKCAKTARAARDIGPQAYELVGRRLPTVGRYGSAPAIGNIDVTAVAHGDGARCLSRSYVAVIDERPGPGVAQVDS